MEELTAEQWMEKSSYLRKMNEYTLFTTEEDFKQLQSGEKVDSGDEKIPVDFLKRVLNNDFYYEYASRYFHGQIEQFKVSYIIYGDIGGSLTYKRSNIIRGIRSLIGSQRIKLNPEEQQKYQNLTNSISFEKFLEKHKGNFFHIDIDNIPYSIPIEQLIGFLQLSDHDFNNICFNQDVDEIHGIPKLHFIYALLQFFEESKATANYLIPTDVRSRYITLNLLSNVDVEAINKLLTTSDTKYREVQLDPLLEQAILSGMPKDATDLEKALYIYIKMCKLLTYDDEYYAVNQKGIATQKHKNVNHVSFITPTNNKVVCFEFNLIYSKLLSQLGIHFCSDYKGFVGDDLYGEGHANLEFRTGKFLVKADSVTSILQGDLTQAKLNQPLVGIKCINRNEQTKAEFNASLRKMYQLIVEQENSLGENQSVAQTFTLDELLEEYSHCTNQIRDVDFHERFSILIDKANSSHLEGIDFLSYTLQLRRILFTEEQRKQNIGVTIVRNNEPYGPDQVAMASSIFTLNEQGFDIDPSHNQYFYFDPHHEPVSLTKDELQTRFDEGVLEYVAKDDPKIPGIEDGGMNR